MRYKPLGETPPSHPTHVTIFPLSPAPSFLLFYSIFGVHGKMNARIRSQFAVLGSPPHISIRASGLPASYLLSPVMAINSQEQLSRLHAGWSLLLVALLPPRLARLGSLPSQCSARVACLFLEEARHLQEEALSALAGTGPIMCHMSLLFPAGRSN